VERSKKRVRIGGSLSVGFGRRRGAAGRIARSTEIKMLKRHNVTRSPCGRPTYLPYRGDYGSSSKAYPDTPTFNSVVASKELPLVSWLTGRSGAGAVLLLLDVRKVFVIHCKTTIA
jgi:hypothetical protein